MCLVGLHCRCWTLLWLLMAGGSGLSFSQKLWATLRKGSERCQKNNALRPRTGIRPEDVSRSLSSPLLPWINSEQAWRVLRLHQHLSLAGCARCSFERQPPKALFCFCDLSVQCVSRFDVRESLRRVNIPRLVMDRTSNLPEAVTWAYDLISYDARILYTVHKHTYRMSIIYSMYAHYTTSMNNIIQRYTKIHTRTQSTVHINEQHQTSLVWDRDLPRARYQLISMVDSLTGYSGDFGGIQFCLEAELWSHWGK